MKKLKKMKQDTKIIYILIAIMIVCFISIGILFYKYFYAGTSSSKYGDRLDGIENYKLDKNLEKEVADLYKEEDSIDKVTLNVKGKIIYITLEFKEDINVDKAKELAEKSLEKIGEDNLTYYEIQYLLQYTGEDESKEFTNPVFGSKNANSLKVTWSYEND